MIVDCGGTEVLFPTGTFHRFPCGPFFSSFAGSFVSNDLEICQTQLSAMTQSGCIWPLPPNSAAYGASMNVSCNLPVGRPALRGQCSDAPKAMAEQKQKKIRYKNPQKQRFRGREGERGRITRQGWRKFPELRADNGRCGWLRTRQFSRVGLERRFGR